MINHMKGEEFIRKVTNEEKDFENIVLEEGFNFNCHESFAEMQKSLLKQDHEKNPICINNSVFKNVKAKGIYLPNIQGKHIDFEGADFENANLWEGYLRHSYFRNANFKGANFLNADLHQANLWEADFSGAHLEYTNLWDANLGNTNFGNAYLNHANIENAYLQDTYFGGANLVGIQGLNKKMNIKHENFFETKVTEKELEILEEALSKKKLFILV